MWSKNRQNDLKRNYSRVVSKIRVIFSFLSVKRVPILSWSSPNPLNIQPRFVTVIFLILGLALFGFGEALLVASGAGVSPWTVLAQGLGNFLGWSIGFSTLIISVTVLLLWVPLRQVPGIGTILNAIIIAFMLEYALPFLPKPNTQSAQLVQAFFGVLVTGLGGGIYLISNLGPGPRDGLMTGLQKLTNFPIAWVRSGIEITAVIAGWLMGGTVGLGTLLFAFFIGPSVAGSLFLVKKISQ